MSGWRGSPNMAKVPSKLRALFHAIGLSCLGSALFLQTTVFMNIAQKGYFLGIENNKIIFSSEIGLTVFALAYFGYVAIHFIYKDA